MSLQPHHHFGTLGIDLNFCLATVSATLSAHSREEVAELGELGGVHHIRSCKVSGDICEAQGSGTLDKFLDDTFLGVSGAEVATHKARFGGLNGHMILGDVRALVKRHAVMLADFMGQGICEGLLGVLSVILVGSLDGGQGDGGHGFFLSLFWLVGSLALTALIL